MRLLLLISLILMSLSNLSFSNLYSFYEYNYTEYFFKFNFILHTDFFVRYLIPKKNSQNYKSSHFSYLVILSFIFS